MISGLLQIICLVSSLEYSAVHIVSVRDSIAYWFFVISHSRTIIANNTHVILHDRETLATILLLRVIHLDIIITA